MCIRDRTIISCILFSVHVALQRTVLPVAVKKVPNVMRWRSWSSISVRSAMWSNIIFSTVCTTSIFGRWSDCLLYTSSLCRNDRNLWHSMYLQKTSGPNSGYWRRPLMEAAASMIPSFIWQLPRWALAALATAVWVLIMERKALICSAMRRALWRNPPGWICPCGISHIPAGKRNWYGCLYVKKEPCTCFKICAWLLILSWRFLGFVAV